MAKKIVITSGKGGVGKTTVVANLGYSLADLGHRVALVDVDFGLNNLDVTLGLENRVEYDMLDVFEGRCRVKQALLQHHLRKNLYVLPSGRLRNDSGISGQNLKLLIEGMSKIFDFVLIDCPAGIDIGFHRAISCSDQALIIATPTLSSIRDADKVINIIKSYKLERVNLVVNRARGDLMLDEKMMFPSDIKEVLRTDLIGVLPEEDNVFLSIGGRLPKNCDSYKAYKMLANNVIHGTNKLFDVTTRYSGFFGSIKRGIKKSL